MNVGVFLGGNDRRIADHDDFVVLPKLNPRRDIDVEVAIAQQRTPVENQAVLVVVARYGMDHVMGPRLIGIDRGHGAQCANDGRLQGQCPGLRAPQVVRCERPVILQGLPKNVIRSVRDIDRILLRGQEASSSLGSASEAVSGGAPVTSPSRGLKAQSSVRFTASFAI